MRLPEPTVEYSAFVDMSGGSNDDAVCAIGFRDADDRAVVARLLDQGQPPPFDPRKAVARFAAVLKEYRVFTVTGDKFAGETFIQDFGSHGIGYQISDLTKSQLYETLEPRLNSRQVILLDDAKLESQFLGLGWRGGKIDHLAGEHDDYSNACAGLVQLLNVPVQPELQYGGVGRRVAHPGAEGALNELIPWQERGTQGAPGVKWDW